MGKNNEMAKEREEVMHEYNENENTRLMEELESVMKSHEIRMLEEAEAMLRMKKRQAISLKGMLNETVMKMTMTTVMKTTSTMI